MDWFLKQDLYSYSLDFDLNNYYLSLGPKSCLAFREIFPWARSQGKSLSYDIEPQDTVVPKRVLPLDIISCLLQLLGMKFSPSTLNFLENLDSWPRKLVFVALTGFNLQDFSRLQFSGEHSKAQKHCPGHSWLTNLCQGSEHTFYTESPWIGIQDGPECPVLTFSFWALILSFFDFSIFLMYAYFI